ncbi:hypothetical protein COV93_00750 [Candidatus Woesearchaeota archaeon CG11_big_fil_rev_8_21_14_0_20_43_8]|nr:MAG: hypothetical protein COV93_00750 [Candidatus Woesearchaeota archaeon CG11_big_fil_rev_8_21_14_0_20_43_8]
MGSLEKILADMDSYDWDSVDDYRQRSPESYRLWRQHWIDMLDASGLSLTGSLLDVACGPVSLGAYYPDTIGLDADPKYIKAIRKQSIRGIIGDFRDMPFDDDEFDYSVCFSPPLAPYELDTLNIQRDLESCELVKEVTSEMIRVTKKKVLIVHTYYANAFAPQEFKHLVEKRDTNYILYSCR